MPKNYVKKSTTAFVDEVCDDGLRRKNNGDVLYPEEPNEIQIEKVKCQICTHILGKIDMGNFSPPLRGDQFFAIDEKHGYPVPFHPTQEWVDLRCPMCHTRPFMSKNWIVNEKDEKVGFLHECDECGAGFDNVNSLNGHKNIHR